MSLQSAAYYAGWTNALDTARAHLDEDLDEAGGGAGAAALVAARFDGIATAETRNERDTLDAATEAVQRLLDLAAEENSAAVELTASRIVIDDLDIASEALTMLAVVAHKFGTELVHATRPPPLTPSWALGGVSGPPTG